MSGIVYCVQPMSSADIELDSFLFLLKHQKDVLYGNAPLDTNLLLDNIFEDKGFCLQIVGDKDFPIGIFAVTEMNSKIIKIRESDYITCDVNGFARMNIAHEVAHSRLHSDLFNQHSHVMYRTQGNRLPAYLSSEWQASVWASCCLMPFPATVKVIVDGENSDFTQQQIISTLEKKFIVSQLAAKTRYLTIKKYQDKGNYNEIKKRIEKEIYK